MPQIGYPLNNVHDEFHELIPYLISLGEGREIQDCNNPHAILARVFGGKPSTMQNRYSKGELKMTRLSKAQIEQANHYFDESVFKITYFDEEIRTLAKENYETLIKVIMGDGNSTFDTYDAVSELLNPSIYSSFPTHFYNHTFYLFERFSEYNKEIARKIITFEKVDVLTAKVTLIPAEEDLKEWVGQAHYLSGERLLVVQLLNSKTSSYCHLLIEVVRAHPEICIGHISLRNTDNDNIVSKLIVLQQYVSLNSNPPSTGTFALGDTGDEKIPEAINNLLLVKTLNRLSSPHQIQTYDVQTLTKWYTKNNSYDGLDYYEVKGEYLVYYWEKPEKRKLVTDKLKLTRLSKYELEAEYIHSGYLWFGKGSINEATHTINFFLRGPLKKKTDFYTTDDKDDKPIFLTIDIPPKEKSVIAILAGIVAGPRDEDKGSVARLILMKKTILDINIEAEREEFFRLFSDRLRVRPPSEKRIHNLETLKDEIEFRQSLETIGIGKDTIKKDKGLNKKKSRLD